MAVDSSRGSDSGAADGPLTALVEQYESLLGQVTAKRPAADETVYEMLSVRDRIAAAGRDGPSPPHSLAVRISGLDERLKSQSHRIVFHDPAALERLRGVVQPPEENWWWRPEGSPNPLWTISAVLFLTVSITMITDFTRRMLSADPDELGILSIAVQALFAVAATSTFTAGGRQWIENLLLRWGVRPQFQPRWKLASTLALFVLVSLAWGAEPPRLARRYNDLAFVAEKTDPASALQLYERAIALNPKMPEAHFNLGEFYETKYEYEKAAGEYQKTIVVSPSHVKAYANLSRVLVLSNQPLTALRVADDAAKLPPPDGQTMAALHKDLAWAEFQLGFYSQAEADGKRAAECPNVAAAAYCVLGKVYTRVGKVADAQRAWRSFSASIRDPKRHSPMVEPDCSRLAEVASHEGK